MQIAANQLLSTTDSVTAVANAVGYESEAAFSRAFKKVLGLPPSEWRKSRALAGVGPAPVPQDTSGGTR
jgi:AraC-like DNA-binding protein